MTYTIANRAAKVSPLRLFETNYRLLIALIPEMRQLDRFAMGVRGAHPDLEVEIVERGRYTTTLVISKAFGDQREMVPDLSIKVRVYHDAGVAEVLSYQGCDRIPPSYLARGNSRYLKDEKRQVNEFLGQLVSHYLNAG